MQDTVKYVFDKKKEVNYFRSFNVDSTWQYHVFEGRRNITLNLRNIFHVIIMSYIYVDSTCYLRRIDFAFFAQMFVFFHVY